MSMNDIFPCDVVEVVCRHDALTEIDMFEKNPDYRMLHTQVYKPVKVRNSPEIMKGRRQYNVIVYLVDAMSSTAAERYLPRTLRFMEKSMEAVKFDHLNRVAFSSKQNGFVLFYGKTMEEIDRPGYHNIPPDEVEEEVCRRALDDDISIFHEFRDMGYITMYTDDYGYGLFAYPNCRSIRKQIMDHTFDQLLTYTWHSTVEYLFHGWGCQHTHNLVNTMTSQVYQTYTDKPKFIWNWLVRLSHDHQYAAHILDRDMVEFFYENKEMMDNSFVILMADHGCRGCPAASTELGRFEINNPLLTISVPKELRHTDILGVLKENFKKLQSHYDIRATLLDILKYQPLENYGGREYRKISGERGSSMLRKQPGERNCFNLPIPYQYCICQQNYTLIDRKSKEAVQYGKLVVHHINSLLREKKMHQKCVEWEFDQVIDLKRLEPFEESKIVKIVVKMKPYKNAEVMTTIRENEDGTFSFGTLDRVDRFGDRNNCDNTKLQAMCDCKSNWLNP